MSGKGSGRGSYQGRGGRGRGINNTVYSYSGDTPKHNRLFSELGNHVFDYSQKA